MSDDLIFLLPRPSSMQTVRARLGSAYQLSRDQGLGEVEELNIYDTEGSVVCVISYLPPSPAGGMEKELLSYGVKPEELQGFLVQYGQDDSLPDILTRLLDFPDTWVYPASTERLMAGKAYAARVAHGT